MKTTRICISEKTPINMTSNKPINNINRLNLKKPSIILNLYF